MKKALFGLIILNLIISVNSFSSWWGDMSKTERASVIATGALITRDRYDRYNDNNNNSINEAKYKQDMKEMEERLRKEYDAKLEQMGKTQKKANPNMPVPVENQEVTIQKNNNRYIDKEEQLKETEENSQIISPEELQELKKISEQAEQNNKEQ
jgi:hypothetical protein